MTEATEHTHRDLSVIVVSDARRQGKITKVSIKKEAELKYWVLEPSDIKSLEERGTSLAVQWLWLHTLTAQGPGSTPGWRTKIPQPCGKPKNDKKKRKRGWRIWKTDEQPVRQEKTRKW